MSKDRKIKIYSGCKTYGIIDITKEMCDDPECGTCNRTRKAWDDTIKEYAESWANQVIEKYKNQENA